MEPTPYEKALGRLRKEPKTWLVTGAAGFIGSHLVETLLANGQRVVGLDDFSTGYRHNLDDVRNEVGEGAWERFTFHEGDIRRSEDCVRACEGVDYVLHQAALVSVPRSIADPVRTHQVNVDGFVNMLIVARDGGVQRFVYASSSAVYGDHPGLPKVEQEIGTPLSPYAVTKRTNEIYARTFQDHYGLQTVGLRYFNVFGRRQDPDGPYAAVIPKWIAQMLAGDRCVIYGDGETSRDFCHVANAVQANLLAATAKEEATGRVYNVAVGERTTLTELHGAIREDLSTHDAVREIAEPVYGEFRPGDVRHSLADTRDAADRLGYRAAVSAREGLREVMSSYARSPNGSARAVENGGSLQSTLRSQEDSRIAESADETEETSNSEGNEGEVDAAARPLQLLRQLISLLNRRERWQIGVLAVALVGRAAVEMVGVGSIVPFMSVVADPSAIQANSWLRWAYETFGFTSTTSFLTAMGLAIVILLAVMNTFSALTVWGMLRFSWGMHHRLSNRLLKGYLAQPYSFFVQRNSASFSKTLLNEVASVTRGVLAPVLNVGARSLVVLALTGLLIALDPIVALIVVLILGGAYGTTYLLVREKQRRLGRERVDANQLRYKVTNEAFGGIKDVKVLQREAAFASRFMCPSWTFSKATATNSAIAFLPRYLFETIAFGGIVLIVLYFLQAGAGLAHILPIISLYAFAGYRLMPELQQLFVGLANIRFNRAALDDLIADLYRFVPEEDEGEAASLPFRKAVRFESVSFRYPASKEAALEKVSLSIPRHQTIGLVGESGSGKTTLVDLLLGLYKPNGGRVLIDGIPLDTRTIPAWRRRVGYVPQHIYLCDDTISANIAFGVPESGLDKAKIERAARIAHLDAFIRSLPAGYSTLVGERGVRLSGGQRQRVGIARALYHDPDVLILDEATSSLDGGTESAVMEAIRELAGRKTIVLIAHRLTTVMDCDRIHVMEKGRVIASGHFAELTRTSPAFRTLAKLEPTTKEVVRSMRSLDNGI